jgi:hemerythrin-like domain-containing protein
MIPTATQNLEKDHLMILQLIDVMFTMSERKSAHTSHLETVISVIRNFADGFHHAKEENFLFPAMIIKGFSEKSGPVAVMLDDHAQGRKYVQAMDQSLDQYKQGDEMALDSVYENMNRYGILLQSHIAKENNVLFRMADKTFSAEEQSVLLGNFQDIENQEKDGRNISAYLKAINELKVFYK